MEDEMPIVNYDEYNHMNFLNGIVCLWQWLKNNDSTHWLKNTVKNKMLKVFL